MHGPSGSSQPAAGSFTRFAPSPTGPLHLGHVAHAAWVWGAAQVLGSKVVLRIEDHDRGRCRPEYEYRLLEDLGWLGLEPDLPRLDELRGGASRYRQSDSAAEYRAALQRLERQGLVYGCDCSRSTIAQQVGDRLSPEGERRYPGTCRERLLRMGPGVGARVRMPEGAVLFDDLILGSQRQVPAEQCGDLLVLDRHGNWTYQFAVVVDDLRHEIDLVVRGADLLASTGRQVLLGRLLGRPAPPRFLHHGLVTNSAGVKLSKKDRAMALSEWRRLGRTAAEVLGEALSQGGVLPAARPVAVEELGGLIGKRLRSVAGSVPPTGPI